RALLLDDRGPDRPQAPADPVPQEPGHDRRPALRRARRAVPPHLATRATGGRPMVRKGGALAGLDLTLKLTPKQEEARLVAAQGGLWQLGLVLGGQIGEAPKIGPPVCVVFEGWDASGKGGAIKRLVEPLDPRHVRVAQFGAPTYDEKRHHFLWRFWPVLPGWGGLAVLDRSWYGRVPVERGEGVATAEQWGGAYRGSVRLQRTLAGRGAGSV